MPNEKSTQSVEVRVHNIIREQLGLGSRELKPEDLLEKDLKADSLDRLELTMALEDEFGLEVPDSEAESLTTVQQVVDYFTQKQST